MEEGILGCDLLFFLYIAVFVTVILKIITEIGVVTT